MITIKRACLVNTRMSSANTLFFKCVLVHAVLTLSNIRNSVLKKRQQTSLSLQLAACLTKTICGPIVVDNILENVKPSYLYATRCTMNSFVQLIKEAQATQPCFFFQTSTCRCYCCCCVKARNAITFVLQNTVTFCSISHIYTHTNIHNHTYL